MMQDGGADVDHNLWEARQVSRVDLEVQLMTAKSLRKMSPSPCSLHMEIGDQGTSFGAGRYITMTVACYKAIGNVEACG